MITADKIECPTAFGYFGGKFEMSKVLVKKIPSHKNYIELFAGGLSMFFRKSKVEWNLVNDLNRDIANFYWVISHPYLYEQFKHTAFYIINSRILYDEIEDMSLKRFIIPNVYRAAMYLFYLSACFNKRIGTGFSDNPGNWKTDILDVLELSRKKLDNVIVENMDYVEVIRKYWNKNDTFWYIDPPYVVADKEQYYKYNFSESKHVELRDLVDEIIKRSNSNIMISYDKLPIVNELYGDSDKYYINEINTTYSSNSKKTTELYITNYKIELEQVGLFDE